MKKNLLFAIGLILLMIPSAAHAQKDSAKREEMKAQKGKVEALKKEYITKELSMTEAEAQKFWPLYDELQYKLHEQHQKDRKIGKEIKDNFDKLTDAELKQKTDALFAGEAASIQLKKDYLQKYAAVLGQKRATKVLHLEREFKKELMKRMRENHSGDGSGKTPPPGR